MGRPKKSTITLASIEDCTRAMGELLEAEAEIAVIEAEYALAIAKAGASLAPLLNEERKRAKDNEIALRNYYYAHLAELEVDGRKSFQLANGVIGRRNNPPKLKPLNRNWSWATIAIAVKEKFGWKYFHDAAERELNRNELKESLTDEQLLDLGLKAEGEEVFYAEPLAAAPSEVKA